MEIPKFFCENCGKEVKRNARFCPHCGRFFASVRCPSCNYFGHSSQFAKGCPKCGYAFHPEKEKKEATNTSSSKKARAYDDALPKWVYFLVFGILLVVIVVVLFH
ncbi:MAG: zinc ribbon domain-containing protein [Treponema sp.]